MQVLNRNWKNSKNNIQEINKTVWKENKIYLYINNLKKDSLVLAKLRNSNNEIYGKIEEVNDNEKLIYVAYFETKEFGNKLNCVWDFYVNNNNNNKSIRLKSNLDDEENVTYKLPNKKIQLQPYNTVQYNFSLKVLKSTAITKINGIDIKNDTINISLNILTDKKISDISVFEKNNKLRKYLSIKEFDTINNYINSDVVINIPIDKVLEDVIRNKTTKLYLTVTYIDDSNETINLKVKNNFINENITFHGKKVYLYENKNELYIKYEEKQIEAQVKSIYSYNDKFIINGYIESYLYEKIEVNNLLIVNRETQESIFQNIEMLDESNFRAEIYLKDLLDVGLINGVWDLYLNLGNKILRLESTMDDIENKQKSISIPQRMIGNDEDTYVYKLYYSLQNELSLIIRKYINIKGIREGQFSKNELILKGNFFVEPPLQVLPECLSGTVNIAGYYNRNYSLKAEVITEPTSKRYYTNFNMKVDLSILSEKEKQTLREDLLCNTILFDSNINEFKVKMIGAIDGKGLSEDLNKISRFINYNRKDYIKKSYKIFNKVLPINNNMAIYQSFHGKSFSCSPKAIHSELVKSKDKYKGIWVLENEYTNVPEGTVVVKPNTLKYYYYMARAKYFVNNGNFPDFYEKREGTVHLQTWHGTPLKKLGYDISQDSPSYNENNSPELIRRNSRWDYLIGPNEYTSTILKRAFGFEKEMLDVGYPRNDILHNYKEEKIDEIKNKLGIDKDKKVVLYAPTWRDSDFHGGQANQPYKLKFNIENFKKKFGDTHVLLLRLHYRDASRLAINLSDKTVINASFYDDIQELYLISDMLITDYSSVMFDYANLKRPMIFYCYDYLKYKSEMRGCYFNFATSAPGPIVFDEEQLFDAIDNSNIILKGYKKNMNSFYNKFCAWEDGNASKRVIDRVFKSMQ